jgi:hypothetical protein
MLDPVKLNCDNILMASILPKFFAWYYVDMVSGLLKAWKNFLLFNMEYFSIPTLLGTLFSHWHKYYSPYSKMFDLWKNIESLVFNLMSRIIGAMLRIVLIILGIVLEIFILAAGFAVLIFWIVLPAVLIFGLLFGFKLLFF